MSTARAGHDAATPETAPQDWPWANACLLTQRGPGFLDDYSRRPSTPSPAPARWRDRFKTRDGSDTAIVNEKLAPMALTQSVRSGSHIHVQELEAVEPRDQAQSRGAQQYSSSTRSIICRKSVISSQKRRPSVAWC